MERCSFRTVSGESPKTVRKLCVSTKLPHHKIRWNYGIFCSESLSDSKACLFIINKLSDLVCKIHVIRVIFVPFEQKTDEFDKLKNEPKNLGGYICGALDINNVDFCIITWTLYLQLDCQSVNPLEIFFPNWKSRSTKYPMFREGKVFQKHKVDFLSNHEYENNCLLLPVLYFVVHKMCRSV